MGNYYHNPFEDPNFDHLKFWKYALIALIPASVITLCLKPIFFPHEVHFGRYSTSGAVNLFFWGVSLACLYLKDKSSVFTNNNRLSEEDLNKIINATQKNQLEEKTKH